MQQPEDYGRPPIPTLASVGDPTPSRNHSLFWNAWNAASAAVTPRLRGPGVGAGSARRDPSDPGAVDEFEGFASVRVGGKLLRPSVGVPIRAGLVTLHGYDDPPPLMDEEKHWRSLAERGVLVFMLRVRGYPGSRSDLHLFRGSEAVGKPAAPELGYITRGLDAPSDKPEDTLAWMLPRAVMDVVHAVGALREVLAREMSAAPREEVTLSVPPVYLHGESFGGGLAVLAAAQLCQKGEGPARLALGLPSLGDWPWRRTHAMGFRSEDGRVRATGLLREVHEFLLLHGATEEAILDRLRLLDAVVHASRVRSPTLCKLALRDDVVPAPTAASIFNALGVDPGRKHRFVVPFGHFDGGLRNARRHALFESMLLDYFDPARTPEEAVHAWESVLLDGHTPGAASPHTQGMKPP